jgi:hypothetical protein
MRTAWFAAVVVGLVVAGFAAGFFLERAEPGRPAHAESYVVTADAFYLVDYDKKVKAHLKFTEANVPEFALLDENGASRIVFAIDRSGAPFLSLRYPDGGKAVMLWQPCTELRITPETEIHIGEAPPERPDQPRIVGDGLLPKIEVYTPEGKVAWSTDPLLQP